MDTTSSFLLQLVRLGIHSDAELTPTPPEIDWAAVEEMAASQRVTAIAWDGYLRLYEAGMVTVDMDEAVKKLWLASVFARHGIRMMVLKGYGLSLNYPVPMHRPCGDVDFWTFGEAARVDRLLADELGIQIEGSPEHHTTFHFEGQYFEHHHNFVSAQAHPSSKVVEARLNELASRGEEAVDVDGQTIYLPSPDFHALFLLRHAAAHLAGSRINIRQILDWGLFVEKNRDRIDWRGLEDFVEKVKMTAFYRVINGICVDYLGFSSTVFPTGRDASEQRVLEDMLCPEFSDPCPSFFLAQWLWRLRRWLRRAWKQKLVYPEPLMRTFFARLLSLLKNPGSLIM